MKMDFAGKGAFVTGAGGGIGLQVAKDLLADGANVTLFDLKPPPEDFTSLAGEALYLQGDLTDEAAVGAAFEKCHAAAGRLDYLVNAAGVLMVPRDRSLLEIELGDWERVMAINLTSMVHTARAAVPLMRKTGGGAMVHFSSIQCLRGDSQPQDAYQASKAGMVALSKSLAIQLAKDNIRSNTILPGATLTPMMLQREANPLNKISRADYEAKIPLGRLAAPRDMSSAALFLLSDLAAYITGIELIVDGGWTSLP
ncbi:MAG: SDR family NAD(P)-dependent oxidoreductase [Alphaproteobacteria bacterium]|nr:SDR family NAD(P)-dependent oxidoreductase [Pseudomonadota bacterium]